MKKDHDSNLNLKGTFISVMAVGVIIIIMWVSIYFLYINRL
ncbi:cytochrome C oxidase subunit II [Halobacillus dabanensis]|nr:cytochrome C oxidase subunit II [Halobacillus dabanensis]